ncbi:MAG: SulP family inorganic anion transporter [Anaerolineae bacterium]|nr:SulP family inorganic anion transporter [Anaerolineae bacterium]
MEQITAATQHLKPERANIVADVIAGLTFAVVNVPQAMAHALLATVNPVLGIYTLMVAVPIGAIATSSVFMNVSTTSALSVAAGSGLAGVPAAEKMQALAMLVLLVGMIQLLAGILRLGFLLRFVSNAVMTGFLNGVAILIILGQLGDLTGFESVFSNNVMRAADLLLNPTRIDIPTTITGLFTLGLIVLLLRSKLAKFAFIIAIGAATAAVALLSLPALPSSALFSTVETVSDIAKIPRSLPTVALPDFRLLGQMLLPAFSVAVIGLIQGAGVSQGTPNPNGKFSDVSRDFFGQGVANFATSFVGGLPAGGSISGTALILGAGARSRWTNIFAGLFVALVVLLVAPLVELVPMPALAALLIVAGFQGLRLPQAVLAWNTGMITRVVMLITLFATLFVSLQFAVLMGVALSIVLYVFRASNRIKVTEWVLQPRGFPLEQKPPRIAPSERFTLLNIYGSLFFASAGNIEEMLPQAEGSRRAVVAIVIRGESEVGSTFINVLQRYAGSLRKNGGRLMLVGVDPAVREQLAKTGSLNIIGNENIFLATPQIGESVNSAVKAAYEWLGQSPDEILLNPSGER